MSPSYLLSRLRARAGFTLLEIVIALVILTAALIVLVESQGQAVFMTFEGQKVLTATWLAEEKVAEVQRRLEEDGFTESDIEEEGDFDDIGEGFGDGLDIGEAYEEFHWAYTIRQVELQLGDVGGLFGQMETNGYQGGAAQSGMGSMFSGMVGTLISSMLSPELIAESLAPYLREVRVRVWWSEREEDGVCLDCVEIVTHAINPSGAVKAGDSAPPAEP